MKIRLLLSLLIYLAFTLDNLSAQSFTMDWAHGFGNTQSATKSVIKTDQQGNVYLSGGFLGTVDFDPGPGVLNLTSQNQVYGDSYLLKMDANGNVQWVKQWNLNPLNNSTFSGSQQTIGLEFEITTNGIFITGAFAGTSDMNPGTGISNLSVNGGGWWDAFILKIDFNGNYLWSQRYGGTIIDCGRDIAFDDSNNIYLLGYFSGTADFNYAAPVNNLTTNGGADNFILKLDSAGNYLWVKKIGGSADDDFLSLEIDNTGNIYFGGGYFHSPTIDMDPGPGVFNLTANGNWCSPLAKLDANGNFLWAVSLGNNSQIAGFATFELNPVSNQLYYVGKFQATLDVDPGPSINTITSIGSTDIFLVCLNDAGNYQWSLSFGGPASEDYEHYYSSCLSFDANGRIYLTGSFNQTVDFDPGPLTNNITSAGANDIFCSVFSAGGNYIQTVNFGGQGDDIGSSVATFPNDILYLSGRFSNTVDFDPTSGNYPLTSQGQFDHYLVKLNTSFCGYTVYDTVTINVYDTITTFIAVTDTLIIDAQLTGIPTPNNINTLKIYPNPASTHIYIDNGNFASMNGYSIEIRNSLGALVYGSLINQQQFYIDLSSWSGNGTYFVRIIDPSNNVISLKKLIVQ